MAFDPTLTADRVAPQVTGFVRRMNQGRRIPALPNIVKRMAEEEQLHIFNVGPWAHRRELGSLGVFFIQACEKGKPYSTPLIVPGIVTEPIPTSEKDMEWRQEDGRYIAEQIVGFGKMLGPQYDLRPYGVFIAEKKEPSKHELARANEALELKYKELISDIRMAHGRGAKDFTAAYRPDYHDVAARELKLMDEPWLVRANPAGREKCPSCGTSYEVGIVMCASCKYILDEAKFKAMAGRFAK